MAPADARRAPGRSSATPPADQDADARALASTVRLRILRLCLDEPLTNRELAERLGRNPASVLHHVRRLVDRGFLVADPVRRGVRGSREIPYRATGASWRAPRLPGQDRILIDTFLEEVAEADPSTVRTVRLGLRLDAAGRAELDRRVQDVLDDFAARKPTPGGDPVSLFYAVHDDAARRAHGHATVRRPPAEP